MNNRLKFFVFTPFLAALFTAAYFFYFQWSYSKFKSINFERNVFYGNKYIFSPLDDEYIVIMYSSKSDDFKELSKRVPNELGLKIIAIDFYQNTQQDMVENLIPLSAGMDTLLNLVLTFKVETLPVSFKIKRKNLFSFSQSSRINKIK